MLPLHCHQVLQELGGDKALERFRIEYEKLYKALKKSHGEQVLEVVCLNKAADPKTAAAARAEPQLATPCSQQGCCWMPTCSSMMLWHRVQRPSAELQLISSNISH